MKNGVLLLVAAACVMVSACGGGGDPSDASSAGAPDGRARSAGIATQTTSDTLLRIRVDSADPNKITVSRYGLFVVWTWWPHTLVKDDGNPVTSIDDLPQGIGNYITSTGTGNGSVWNKNGHLRIQFDDGTYRLASGWVWPAKASGLNAQRQVVLEKLNVNGTVVFSGARSVQLPNAGGTLQTAMGADRPTQLWAENTRATVARTPDVGNYFYVNDAVPGWRDPAADCAVVAECVQTTMPKAEMVNGAAKTTHVPMNVLAFQADPASIPAMQSVMNEPRGTIVMMQSWTADRVRPAAIDTTTNEVRLVQDAHAGATTSVPFKAFGKVQRYYIENVASALNAAGEWHVDDAGTLRYNPRSTGGGNVTLHAATVSRLLRTQGDAANGQWVQWVQFNGLKFHYSGYSEILPNGSVRDARASFIDPQAAFRISAALEFNDTRNVEINGSEVAHTGGYGIWFNKHATGNEVNDSDVYDTGAGGIKIGIADYNYNVDPAHLQDNNAGTYAQQLADVHRTGSNKITRNRIYGTGHVFPGGVGIWIGRSNGNTVSGNLVKDTTYSGISVGWDWNSFSSSMAGGNTIQGNFLLNIGQSVMSDLAGIYTLGSQNLGDEQSGRLLGTVIKGNVIRNVQGFDAYGPLGAGIYQDQGSSWIEMSGNLVAVVNGTGYTTNRGANNNKVASNVFADVAYLFPAPTLNYPQASADESASWANALATFSGNVSLPRMGIVEVDANNKLPGARSLVMANNQIASQFKPNLGADADPNKNCVLNSPAWCTVSSGPTVTTSSTDAYAIPQLSGVVPGVFTAPSAPNGSLTTWAAEGAKLKSLTASAAPAWAENAASRPIKRVDFDASRWPKGQWEAAGWFIYDRNLTNRRPAIEQGLDGARAVKLESGLVAFAYSDVTSGTLVFKARVYLDGSASLTLRPQHADPTLPGGGPGPMVVLTPMPGMGIVRVSSNAGTDVMSPLATGQWYEVRWTTPVKKDPIVAISVYPLTPVPFTGGFTVGATAVRTATVPLTTEWHELGRIALEADPVGSGVGHVRLGALSVGRN